MGFFGKKKPLSAMDSFIHAMYGNPPPPKRASLDQAIQIAHEELLLELVGKKEVADVATSLHSGPIPYSTHDLAVSTALNFFKRPERIGELVDAQLIARMTVLNWLEEEKVAPLLIQSFEDTLYKLYKS